MAKLSDLKHPHKTFFFHQRIPQTYCHSHPFFSTQPGTNTKHLWNDGTFGVGCFWPLNLWVEVHVPAHWATAAVPRYDSSKWDLTMTWHDSFRIWTEEPVSFRESYYKFSVETKFLCCVYWSSANTARCVITSSCMTLWNTSVPCCGYMYFCTFFFFFQWITSHFLAFFVFTVTIADFINFCLSFSFISSFPVTYSICSCVKMWGRCTICG